MLEIIVTRCSRALSALLHRALPAPRHRALPAPLHTHKQTHTQTFFSRLKSTRRNLQTT